MEEPSGMLDGARRLFRKFQIYLFLFYWDRIVTKIAIDPSKIEKDKPGFSKNNKVSPLRVRIGGLELANYCIIGNNFGFKFKIFGLGTRFH